MLTSAKTLFCDKSLCGVPSSSDFLGLQVGFKLELNFVTSPRALDRSRDTHGALSLEENIDTWISLEPKFHGCRWVLIWS